MDEDRIILISKQCYVEMSQALATVDRWRDGEHEGFNFVLYSFGTNGSRKLVFKIKE